jgi:hypothetical protein
LFSFGLENCGTISENKAMGRKYKMKKKTARIIALVLAVLIALSCGYSLFSALI